MFLNIKHLLVCKVALGAALFVGLMGSPLPAGAQTGLSCLVQVMSVRDKATADREAARITEAGAPAFSHEESLPEKGVWHRVYLGPFDGRGEAEAAAEHLKAEGVINDYIIRMGGQEAAPANSSDEAPPIIISPDETPVYQESAAAAEAAPEERPLIIAAAEASASPEAEAGFEGQEELPVYKPAAQPAIIPAKATGPMKINGFVAVVDLSSSMRRLAPCQGYVKEEIVNSLLREMNQRIPSHPYQAALRVFGYKKSWTRNDYTINYYGLAQYSRDQFDLAIGRLIAADSVSPFGWALAAADNELGFIEGPKAVLMFADFEVSADAGSPVNRARTAVRKYGSDLRIYTFYVTRSSPAVKLAQEIAQAGGGRAYDICHLMSDGAAFEAMMMEIFGPADEPPCPDQDDDGVCDDRDLCPNTPAGAPVDSRGCWIAAYSQFFDFDKAEVKSAFLPRLQNAAEIIRNNPQIEKIVIAGHTDNVGSEQYNLNLGRRRAESVRDILVKYGAASDRFEIESYGKSKPIADNDTDEGRSRNRRVEFHVGDTPVAYR